MYKVDKVLAALCLSERSIGVLNLAADLAHRFDAELIAVNVINVRDVQSVSQIESMGYDVRSDDYLKGVREERRKRLADIISDSYFPGERLKTLILVGHPEEQILNTVEEEQADLLVIGAKGRTNLSYLLVGSVADKLFRHSPVPVVSYRHRATHGGRT